MFCETRPNRAQAQRTEEQTVTETCADDFATIRARMEELRREVERGEAGQTEARSAFTLAGTNLSTTFSTIASQL
jgi:hypothetical protein